MAKRIARPIVTEDFAGKPFRVAFLRGVGYVVVEADTLVTRAEFDGDGQGYAAAYELAAELNLEHAAEVADSAAQLTEARDGV